MVLSTLCLSEKIILELKNKTKRKTNDNIEKSKKVFSNLIFFNL